jgi:signal transduction histidine kinase
MSIRLRLTLWYSGILAVTLILFGIVLYSVLSYYLDQNLRKDLEHQADVVTARIQKGYSLSPLTGQISPELYLNDYDIRSTTAYLLQLRNLKTGSISRNKILENGQLVLPLTDDMKKETMHNGSTFDQVIIQTSDEQVPLMMYSVIVVNNITGEELGILQIAANKGMINKITDTVQNIFALGVFITIALAATVGWFLARKALQPIDQVTEAAGQIGKGSDLSRRIDYQGPQDEVGRLTDTINGMLARLQTAYSELEESNAAQRRFVSDASHELRTPLTTIRGNVDLLEKMWKKQAETLQTGDKEQLNLSLEAMHDIAGEAERMSRLVNDLLSLARADAGLRMEMEDIELRPLVEEVARRAQFLPRKADWMVGDLGALDGVHVRGSRDHLQQMLFIFIENGFKYTPHGHVSLEAVRSDGQIGLKIADTGLGIDKEDVPHIFDRFFRADKSRGQTAGTGLGLSIAKWIIDNHGGSVEVKTRPGEGTVFLIWLPICFSRSEE